MSVSEERIFDLSQYLVQRKESSDVTAPDLLILNQPISDFAVFVRLWAQSKYRLCADGGANHLYDMFSGELEARRTDYIPDSIHGDLDSVRDDVRSFYAHHGTQVTQLVDDYSTDFAKAMQKITANNSSASSREVLVLGTLAGRVDHAFGMLHDMIREETTDPRLRLWLYSETNVSFILRNPHNIIKGALSNQNFTENVGILPVYGPATISTAGLEWDVRDWATRLGTQGRFEYGQSCDASSITSECSYGSKIAKVPNTNDPLRHGTTFRFTSKAYSKTCRDVPLPARIERITIA